jgi:hypothetical protein
MIHAMWATFYISCMTARDWGQLLCMPGEEPKDARIRFAITAAEIADAMCAEYDKRNAPTTGSPYRG